MTESFQITRSFIIPPKAIEYLQKAIDSDPICLERIEDVIDSIDTGHGVLYLIANTQIYGSIFCTIVSNPRGKNILNVVLLGGRDFHLWSHIIFPFFKDLTEATNTELCIIGRKAWGRIYPGLKTVGYVYTFR